MRAVAAMIGASSSATASQVPRPLKQPIGLTDSTLTAGIPSSALSGSERNREESRKTAGIR